jgi:hypothetical protein
MFTQRVARPEHVKMPQHAALEKALLWQNLYRDADPLNI